VVIRGEEKVTGKLGSGNCFWFMLPHCPTV
jgi:hypothetical protein